MGFHREEYVSIQSEQGPPRTPIQATLQMTMVSVIVVLLVVTAHTIGFLAYSNNMESLTTLSKRLFVEISRSTENKVRRHLEPAVQVQRELQVRMDLKLVPQKDLNALGQWLAERLRFQHSLDELSFGQEEGQFVSARRYGSDIVITTVKKMGKEQGQRLLGEQYTLLPNGQRKNFQSSDKTGYDPRLRPWYTTAVKANQLTWREPYQWSTGEWGVSCLNPIKDKEQLKGVATADFILSTLTEFLAGIRLSPETRVFLIDRRGQLIASSEGRKPKLDPLLVKLKSQFQDLGSIAIDKPQLRALRVEGKTYFAGLQYFQIEGGLEWATVTIVPEQLILGELFKTRRDTIYIALGALFLAILLGSLLASQVSTPIRKIAKELERIGRFEIDQEELPGSYIAEVNVVSDATERMKASLRSFSRYVPTTLVRQLLEQKQEATLGGETRELTIHFSDIAGFTSLAENKSAHEVVEDLAGYLECMDQVLTTHEGTIDKFMGDGILAFFNAPQSVSEHARKACQSALKAQEVLAQKRPEWTQQGRPPYEARIGLHTGEVLVGNIGTARRFAYTVIGDAVNLASRLEGLNKVYGTWIMASEQTRAQCGDAFEWRKLDKVAVVGRKSGVFVYELLAAKGQLSEAQGQARDKYEAALEAYMARDFKDAEAQFEALIAEQPQDKAAKVLRQRCQNFLEAPPGEDWDGVFRAQSK